MKNLSLRRILISCFTISTLVFLISCQDEGVEEKENVPMDTTATLSIIQPANGGTFSTAPAVKVEITNWDLSKAGNTIAYSLNAGDTIKTDKLEFQAFPNQEGSNTLIVFLTEPSGNSIGVGDTVAYLLEEDVSLHQLTVENGIGAWHYDRGQTAWIQSSFDPPFVFSHWAGDIGVLSDTTADPLSFKMPPANVQLKAVAKAENVSFSQHLFPLMEAKCNSSGCHDASSFPAYTSYEAIKESGENIVLKTQNRQMPPPRHSILTAEEIDVFRAWVEEGMKNN